jgi:predicted phage tail protein
MKARQSDSSVFSFNESNIIRDSFSASLLDRTDHPNRIKLFFHDQSTYNAETEVDLDDQVDQSTRASRMGNDGVVENTLKYFAVDNAQLAGMLGTTLLSESVNTKWSITFKTTVLGLAIEPGDIIDVTHSCQLRWNQKLFRVENIASGDDDRLELQCVEFFPGAYV